MKTIEELRKEGYKIRVYHCNASGTLESGCLYDRVTRITFKSKSQNEYVGAAFCSHKDQYNRKLGNRIALGRALAKCNDAEKTNLAVK